ncbi:SRPBCC domain-containing protein [Chloroflexi bacterium TSY]|nr:SRPBCC domain-containing protein [Chloroflexi bacterium TSY]
MNNENAQVLHMERIFNAPRQVVFDYFTVAELIKTWWGPGGTTTESAEIDLQVGGACRWDMRGPAGEKIVLTGFIKELSIPERIVMIHQWQGSDEETLVTLEFIDLHHKTKLRLTHSGISAATALPAYREGWGGTLERLDRVIDAQ